MAEAAAPGVILALVTGRSFHFTTHVTSELGLPLTVIVNNGAVVKNAAGITLMRQLLPRETARHVLASVKGFDDSVAVVFDRSDNRQIVFEHMDWTHPNRRGYFEKNKAYIASVSPLAQAIDEDPIQVMFNGSVQPMRQLAARLRGLPGADRFSVALTECEPRDFSLLDVNCAGCTKGIGAGAMGGEPRREPRRGDGRRRQPERSRDARIRGPSRGDGQRRARVESTWLSRDRDERRRGPRRRDSHSSEK